jgi:hypothetical protein
MPFAIMPVIGAIWGSPIARTALLIAGAFVFGWYKGWASVPRVDIPAIVRNAESACDAHWEGKMRETEDQARKAIDAAIEAGNSAAVASDADLLQLCRASKSCRDRQ